MQFCDFHIISLFHNILSLKLFGYSWGNSYLRLPDIKSNRIADSYFVKPSTNRKNFSCHKDIKCMKLFSHTFLGGAPTSICHFFHLSVCLSVSPSTMHYISRTAHCVIIVFGVHMCKMIISPDVFFFFSLKKKKSKRAKNSRKWKIKITSVMCCISGTVYHMVMIFGALV